MKRIVFVSGWMLATPALQGCGGDPSGLTWTTGTSESFMPAAGQDAQGKPLGDLHWRYRVNGGKPTGDRDLTFTFDDQQVTVDSGGTRRLSEMHASISAPASPGVTGTFDFKLEERLVAGPPGMVIEQHQSVATHLSGNGKTAGLDLTSVSMPQMPLLEFADRADLDQLPSGHTDERTNVVKIKAQAVMDANGQRMSVDVDEDLTVTQRWTIMEQLPSLEVLGKTYKTVVGFQQDANGTAIAHSQGMQATIPLQVHGMIWVAKGIGVVRSAVTTTTSGGSPTTERHELVESSLEQR